MHSYVSNVILFVRDDLKSSSPPAIVVACGINLRCLCNAIGTVLLMVAKAFPSFDDCIAALELFVFGFIVILIGECDFDATFAVSVVAAGTTSALNLITNFIPLGRTISDVMIGVIQFFGKNLAIVKPEYWSQIGKFNNLKHNLMFLLLKILVLMSLGYSSLNSTFCSAKRRPIRFIALVCFSKQLFTHFSSF